MVELALLITYLRIMIVKILHENIGISIGCIDLSNLDNDTFQNWVKKLWLEYLVIVFPNQNIMMKIILNLGKDLVN